MEINITYKRTINHAYVLFSGGEIPVDSYQVQMVLHRLMDGLLPCSLYTLDNEQRWCCENTSRQKLSVHCQTRALGKEELSWIMGGLLKTLQEMQEFLLDVNTLYLTPEEIYLDLTQKKVYCCMVPFCERDVWKGMFEVSQYILSYLDQKDGEAVTLAYSIFRYLSRGENSTEELWNLLYSDDRTKSAKEVCLGELQPAPDTEDKRKREEQRRRDLDVFFQKEEEQPEKSGKYLSHLAWILPGGFAVIGVLWLCFNRWYLSGMVQAGAAAVILLLGCFAVLNWWKWGRKTETEEEEWDRLFGEEKPQPDRKPKKQAAGPAPENLPEKRKMQERSQVPRQAEDYGLEMPKREDLYIQEEPEEGTALLVGAQASCQAALIHLESGKRYTLDNNAVVVGKIQGVAQMIIPQPAVSRIHARILPGSGGYYLEDLNSKNGTYVNGELLEAQSPMLLQPEDLISFANEKYRYEGKTC